MGQLEGKVAVITGAASGMGASAAQLFAREGAHVVLADLNVAGGEETAQKASALGQRCLFKRTDVSLEGDVEALIALAVSEFGGLDITFNNAGIGGAIGSLETISVEDWDRTQAVCLRGVFLGMKHSVAPMRARGGGSIISTASIAGIDGFHTLHAYCAAKAGVINLTRSASIEYARDFIRTNAIAPGGILTPILTGAFGGDLDTTAQMLAYAQPLPRAGQPLDIANAALFLASDASSFITGHTLVVDGGAIAGSVANAPRPGQDAPVRQQTFAGPSFEQG
jgi:NAD(P)-dependent dehydrogenase (short-subunit alcohol dehydrogenase family)